jgi:hypothetical protein
MQQVALTLQQATVSTTNIVKSTTPAMKRRETCQSVLEMQDADSSSMLSPVRKFTSRAEGNFMDLQVDGSLMA